MSSQKFRFRKADIIKLSSIGVAALIVLFKVIIPRVPYVLVAFVIAGIGYYVSARSIGR